jgi:regulator of protease activity HflC (stomatin/prohibitin superfamily)
MFAFFILLIIIGILLLTCIRQVDQYERGIIFTMGKYVRMWDPGWHLLIPIFQRLIKVDIRVKAVDVPNQEAITKDNIPISINARKQSWRSRTFSMLSANLRRQQCETQ